MGTARRIARTPAGEFRSRGASEPSAPLVEHVALPLNQGAQQHAWITFSDGQTLTAPGKADQVISTINDTDSAGLFTPLMIGSKVVFVNPSQIATVTDEDARQSKYDELED